jgi:hypothetical protein
MHVHLTDPNDMTWVAAGISEGEITTILGMNGSSIRLR